MIMALYHFRREEDWGKTIAGVWKKNITMKYFQGRKHIYLLSMYLYMYVVIYIYSKMYFECQYENTRIFLLFVFILR